MALSVVKQVILKLLTVLKLGGRVLAVLGRGTLTKLYAVTSRSRLAALSITYYVVYKNLDVFMSFNPRKIVVTVGSTLLQADKVILETTADIIAGAVKPVPFTLPVIGDVAVLPGEPFAVLTIITGFITITVWIKAAALAIRSSNPTIGHGGVYGFPIVVYSLSVFAVSALNGNPRFPFQGVIALLQNLDAVVGSAHPGPLIDQAVNATVNAANG